MKQAGEKSFDGDENRTRYLVAAPNVGERSFSTQWRNLTLQQRPSMMVFNEKQKVLLLHDSLAY